MISGTRLGLVIGAALLGWACSGEQEGGAVGSGGAGHDASVDTGGAGGAGASGGSGATGGSGGSGATGGSGGSGATGGSGGSSAAGGSGGSGGSSAAGGSAGAGSGGTAATGGSGGSAGAGAQGGMAGAAGAGGSSGQCPGSEPSGSCSDEARRCGYGSSAGCWRIYECAKGSWQLASETTSGCTGGSDPCPDSQPSGVCSDPGQQCAYDVAQCTCASICSGMPPPDGGAYAWACGAPSSPLCPDSVPKQGAKCPRLDLVCNYGSCGGSVAICKTGGWDVLYIPPPP